MSELSKEKKNNENIFALVVQNAFMTRNQYPDNSVKILFCNFSVRFSVYIVWSSVLSLNNLKLHIKTKTVKNIIWYTRKILTLKGHCHNKAHVCS